MCGGVPVFFYRFKGGREQKSLRTTGLMCKVVCVSQYFFCVVLCVNRP